jgi:hypothetical protein
MTPETQTGWVIRQLAARWHVGQSKILAWIHSGQLRAVNVAANLSGRPRWVVLPDALVEFERRRAGGPPPKPQRRRRRQVLVDFYSDTPPAAPPVRQRKTRKQRIRNRQ